MRGGTVLLYGAVIAAGVAACGERQGDTATSPDLAAGAAPNKPACSYSQLKKDVDAEWPVSAGGATKDTNAAVSARLTTMQQNQADSSIATITGFQIIQSVAFAASQSQPGTTAAAGSKLVTDLFPCMDVPPVTGAFEAALGSAGAFGVRALTATDPAALYTHDGAWNVAPVGGVAWSQVAQRDPSSTAGGASATLSAAAKRIFLIWGQKGATLGFTGDVLLNASGPSPVFSWNTIPEQLFQTSTTPPGPGIQITQCPVDGNTQLGFVQHNPLSSNKQEILSTTTTVCGDGPTAMGPAARSLLQQLADLFRPTVAYAGGTGSSTKGSTLSDWGVTDPGFVNLLFTQVIDKSNNQVGVPLFDKAHTPLFVRAFSNAKDQAGNFTTPFKQGTIFAWIEAKNNQGVNVLVCKNWAYTDQQGVATFVNAFLNKSGGYIATFRSVGTQVETSAGDTPLKVPPGLQPSTALFNIKNGAFDHTACEGNNVYPGTGPLPTPTGNQLSP